jgi:hypothetical protein
VGGFKSDTLKAAMSDEFPFTPIPTGNVDPTQSIVSTEDLASGVDLTKAIVSSAHALLRCEFSCVPTLPFNSDDPANNPYALALKSPVPLDIYAREAVWWHAATAHGNVAFHPWLFRLGFTKAINVYATAYNKINTPHDAPFPKVEFMAEVRRAKNRAYKRTSRRHFFN